MCRYLYEVFSLKRSVGEGLTEAEVKVLARWRGAILSVAIEEMTHLTLVSNLICALGGRPQFQRPNFPAPAEYHPADMIVRLAPFDMSIWTPSIILSFWNGRKVQRLQTARFLRCRRPTSASHRPAARCRVRRTISPLAASTTAFAMGLIISWRRSEMVTSFAVHPNIKLAQECAATGPLRGGRSRVRHSAIDTIVEQGEGAPQHRDDGHFARFCAIKQEYEAVLARNPAFRPARSVATNPVMRKPAIDAENRV